MPVRWPINYQSSNAIASSGGAVAARKCRVVIPAASPYKLAFDMSVRLVMSLIETPMCSDSILAQWTLREIPESSNGKSQHLTGGGIEGGRASVKCAKGNSLTFGG